MKSKEQLAEEYAASQHLNRFAEEWVEKAFLTGFDARDAQLGKLPVFDEAQSLKEWAELDAGRGETWDWVDGARKYHDEIAKVIAAKDEKIRELEHAASGDNAIIAELNHKLKYKQKIIDEKNKQLADPHTVYTEKQRQFDEANYLIDELETAMNTVKDWHDRFITFQNNQLNNSLEEACNNWNNFQNMQEPMDLTPIFEALDKIRQWREK